MENLDILVKELCKQPNESGWVEFKHNNCLPEMIGKDISALANSAVLADRNNAYMIWGVDDSTHDIIGTTIRLKSEKKVIRNLRIGCATCFLKMQTLSCMMLILMECMLS